MPKLKTNKLAKKKFRVTGKGKVKRAQANMSHNTAKKSAKRKRHLRGMKYVDSANMNDVKRQIANLF
jgi:large subunit ribosomal protein L35